MKSTFKEKEKKKIKSFIYLDEYKMYSISSQIFEGLTESITSYSKNSGEERERQKGPIGSGRILADIISKESSTEERKFLHDYSYSLFEEKVINEDRILQIDSNNIHNAIGCIEDYDFVAVKGKILFNDIKLINKTFEDIGKLVDAVARIQLNSNKELFEALKGELSQNNSIKEKNKQGFSAQSKKLSIREEYKSTYNAALKALKEKMGKDLINDELLENFSTVLNYGYEDQFETRTYLESTDGKRYLFSTLLKRVYLREAEALLVKKYSRFSEKDFVVIGMVTQSQNEQQSLSIAQPNSSDSSTVMREAVMQLTVGLSEIEKHFIGKLDNEVMIDPIAIYREL